MTLSALQTLTASAAGTMLAGSAGASFVGLTVEDITDNSLGLPEYALFAHFSNPEDVLLSVNSASITSTTSFYHSTMLVSGAQSVLPWTKAQNAFTDTPDVDSFVTIGLATGDGNNTLLADFDVQGFLEGNSIGDNAFWAAAGGQGKAGEDLKVLLAVLVPTLDSMGKPGVISGALTLFIPVPGPDPGEYIDVSFTTVPAPPAVALLFALPILNRRRRRCDDTVAA